MKIVAIQGSPRRGGNTEIVLTATLEGLKTKQPDAEVLVIRACDKKISGCLEEFQCQTTTTTPGCSIKDDMGEIYAALLGADLIIFASPVFCWTVTTQLKAILDRLYATMKFSENPPRSLLAGKKTALVVTCGGTADDGADLVEKMHERLASFCGLTDSGRLISPLMKEPSETSKNAALLERARNFGASLV